MRSAPTITASTLPWRMSRPAALSAISVCGTPCCSSSQAVSRPWLRGGFRDPDMHRHAGIVRGVDRRQAVPHRPWPASRRCSGSSCSASGRRRRSDRFQSFRPCWPMAFCATSSSAMAAASAQAASQRASGASGRRFFHAGQRPVQVDRRRASRRAPAMASASRVSMEASKSSAMARP